MGNMPSLDARSYIDAFGGRQQLINRMRKRFAVNLTVKQVDKWVERNSIPGAHLVTMEIIGSEMSPSVELLDHIT